MALFTITTNAAVNLPPSQIGDLGLVLDYNELYAFTLVNFTTGTIPQYVDPEGDDVEEVKIVTLPTVGSLTLSSVPVIANDNISNADIVAGNLEYQCDPADTDGYVDNDMTFDISDDGSSTFSGLTAGIVTFTVAAEVNLPPSAVGDNSLTTDYGVAIVFTEANFTTETTPAYADPEADSAECLQILTLPTTGTLKLNGVDVLVNDEILFTDIGLNLFTFTPDNTNTNSYMVDFEFQIKDAGSGGYTG